jgi:hypothetical protein
VGDVGDVGFLQMSEAVVVLRVLRSGERTDCLLEDVGRALLAQPLRADDYGAVVITIARRGPEAWEEVRDALDRAGADWREWLYLQPRPTR